MLKIFKNKLATAKVKAKFNLYIREGSRLRREQEKTALKASFYFSFPTCICVRCRLTMHQSIFCRVRLTHLLHIPAPITGISQASNYAKNYQRKTTNYQGQTQNGPSKWFGVIWYKNKPSRVFTHTQGFQCAAYKKHGSR